MINDRDDTSSTRMLTTYSKSPDDPDKIVTAAEIPFHSTSGRVYAKTVQDAIEHVAEAMDHPPAHTRCRCFISLETR